MVTSPLIATKKKNKIKFWKKIKMFDYFAGKLGN
jgi:hypothetical protein